MPDRSAPVNLNSNVTVHTTPPVITGAQYKACALYNNSPDPLLVVWGSSTDVLQPLTANVYAVPASDYDFAVTPLDSNSSPLYVGTLTAVWYRPEDQVPVFPVSLPLFPGGAFTIAQFVSGHFGTTVYDVQVPIGTGFLVVSCSGAPYDLISVRGDQTGTLYYSTVSTVTAPTSVNIVAAPDTSYTVTISQTLASTPGSPTWINAQPTPAPPTFPTITTDVVNITANPTTVIPAPAYGANYLFGWTATEDSSGAARQFALKAESAQIAELYVPGALQAMNAPLFGFRVTGRVRCNTEIGADAHAFVIVLYSPGP